MSYDDFIAIPISSKTENIKDDELLICNDDLEYGFIPKTSKQIIRKTFVVSKKVVLKKYGTLNKSSFNKYKEYFCIYHGCKIYT